MKFRVILVTHSYSIHFLVCVKMKVNDCETVLVNSGWQKFGSSLICSVLICFEVFYAILCANVFKSNSIIYVQRMLNMKFNTTADRMDCINDFDGFVSFSLSSSSYSI